jgi:aminopeptidase N
MLSKDREEVLAYAKSSSHPIVDTTIKDYMKLLNANSYQKGSWVLHMLRRELGDTLFWKGIRAYYAAYAGSNATTDDFRVVLEKVSGRNLKPFFYQWLFSGGQPSLEVRCKQGPNNNLVVTIKQLQSQVFNFPLEIAFTSRSQKAKTISLQISKKEETFTLAQMEPLEKIMVDPNTNLLFELASISLR